MTGGAISAVVRIAELPTPALLLDRQRLTRNLARMQARAKSLGVDLRPHLKTAKSAAVARLACEGFSGGITVSTLAEAEYFIASGFRDVTYAVGIVPAKLDQVARLQGGGARVSIITDNVPTAAAIAARAGATGASYHVLIEVDVGSGRAGVAPDSEELLAIAAALGGPNIELLGVLTHAGHSYECDSPAAIRAVAEDERRGVVAAAERLHKAGFAAPIVSVGSTPTALFAEHLTGVTEMRPGNFVFFDLFQAGLGTCEVDDIAVSVLASVVGHHRGRNHLLLDAGALALSKDVGANVHRPGTGYGLVTPAESQTPIAQLAVIDVHQEHGIVGHPRGLDAMVPLPFGEFPVGSRMRVLPNHSCMTAAQHDRYYVVEDSEIVAVWDRAHGW